MSQDKDFMELIEEEIPSAASLGWRPISSRPLDQPYEYYQQPLDAFTVRPEKVKKSASKHKGIREWIPFLIFVLCIGAGIGAYLANNTKQVEKVPPAQEQKASVKKKVKEQPKQAVATAVTDKKRSQEKDIDLSLGKAMLGMSMKDVRTVLGADQGLDLKDGYKFHRYSDLQVGEKDGIVNAIVSDGPSVRTSRGLHEGSTYNDMVKAYGDDYMPMKLNNLVLYEYLFHDKMGRKGLLRFAIRNSDKKVDYISIRITE